MAESVLRSGSDYHSLFNPKDYLNKYYPGPKRGSEITCIKFGLESLHEIYSTGKIQGKRMIDVGSGPTIHMLIPAAKWFDELYISDYSKKNIETQKKWFAKDPESYDWQPYFRYFAEKDGFEQSWPEYEERVRDKVKGILACDFHNSNPFHPESPPQFDAVSSSLALECGCKTLDQFRKAMKNVTSCIAPEGFLILLTILKNPYYPVGDEKFWVLSLTAEEVRESVEETGLTIVKSFEKNFDRSNVLCPYDGCMMTVCQNKI